MDELEARFAKVARGRSVSVRFDPKDFLFALDFQVKFSRRAKRFEVVLRRGGCFEGAYRCLERYIEAEAERLDGVNSTPSTHLDLRRNMGYWAFEQVYDQFVSDLESAIEARVSWLDEVRPGENQTGAVKIESRKRGLIGLLAYLSKSHQEVRRGVLSPETIQLCKAIGLDVFAKAG